MTLTHADPAIDPTTDPDPVGDAPWAVSAAEMKATARNTPPPLIDRLLPSQAVVTFAGEPGIGKSFVALSWAAAVAEGRSWFGHKTREPMPVVYVLGEGWSQFGNRVAAWETLHGHQLGPNLRFVDGASQGLDLADPESVDAIIDELVAIEPAMVVFDTFSMLSRIRSENDNAEVAGVFAGAHRMARCVEATVVLIHHVSKGAGQVRGATAFKGNADTVITASRSTKEDEEDTFVLSTRPQDDGKQRDFEPVRLSGFSIAEPGVLARASSVVAAAQRRDEMSAIMAGGGE